MKVVLDKIDNAMKINMNKFEIRKPSPSKRSAADGEDDEVNIGDQDGEGDGKD